MRKLVNVLIFLRYIKIGHGRLFFYHLRLSFRHPTIPFCIVFVVKKVSLNKVKNKLKLFYDIFTAHFSTLPAQSLKIQVLWDVTPCRLLNSYQRFEGAKILSDTLPLTDILAAVLLDRCSYFHDASIT